MLPPNVEGHKDDEDWKSKYSHYADTAPPAAADGGEALVDMVRYERITKHSSSESSLN